VERRERPTRAEEGVEVSLGQVWEILEELRAAAVAQGTLDGIGICAPGPLNPETGVIFNPTNMPGWVDVPLADEVSRRLGVPSRVENDANGAGLAEALFGAYRFLRQVENRLRIARAQPLHTFPSTPEGMEMLARRLGYADDEEGSSRAKLLADYERHAQRVRAIYRKVLGLKPQP